MNKRILVAGVLLALMLGWFSQVMSCSDEEGLAKEYPQDAGESDDNE